MFRLKIRSNGLNFENKVKIGLESRAGTSTTISLSLSDQRYICDGFPVPMSFLDPVFLTCQCVYPCIPSDMDGLVLRGTRRCHHVQWVPRVYCASLSCVAGHPNTSRTWEVVHHGTHGTQREWSSGHTIIGPSRSIKIRAGTLKRHQNNSSTTRYN